MTMATFFDTHRAATRLKSAGFEESKVDALIDILRDAAQDDHLVTKGDLRNEMREVRDAMIQLEQRMVIKLGGLIIAAATVLGVVARYLPPPG